MTDASDADADADERADGENLLRAPPVERSVPELLRFGVVNLDKPAGPSSHQVSAWVRDAIDETLAALDPEGPATGGVAHSGTLDPKVTGCLPTLTGDATRMAQVFLEGTKEYVAVLELHGSAPADFREVVAEFESEIYQKPPRKSAVSRRLRTRTIHDLDVLELDDRQALLRIRCESGTYVRKLCHDVGLATGVGAHMGHLRRTATDPFDDRNLHTLQDLVDALAWAEDGDDALLREVVRPAEDGDDALLREVVRPAEDALTHLPAVTVARSAARSVATGAPVYAPGVIDVDDAAVPTGDDDAFDGDADPEDAESPLVACFTPDGVAVCLGRVVGDPEADSGTVVELERVLL
ncbi:RNA-guided pseudouridylation complex pseudouridine synthase subunit Cbf5 [Halorubrum sp. Atlit-26R]|uniref:RNA-guided pseudouridylation complex pseudouridine synthase subunit Cbf5 n=1 Tax=Halorubrum sp. Atlit-26R TaxID=2282128 RepID=UPI000EF19028|nr:RNA-guided pseudouridylation complex pseudouridine synthase subunit Cbf5 [Halorubrum sp. Atlit-26R]RLM67256.1 RNA-guided pseudouridylation complex pseudouridine synthase subunit Cbf5 [Halorubrum sp. Atlit-26R]